MGDVGVARRYQILSVITEIVFTVGGEWKQCLCLGVGGGQSVVTYLGGDEDTGGVIVGGVVEFGGVVIGSHSGVGGRLGVGVTTWDLVLLRPASRPCLWQGLG